MSSLKLGSAIIMASIAWPSLAVQVSVNATGARTDLKVTEPKAIEENTAIIQAAITKASQHPGGGTVLFGPGTYLISSPLEMTGQGVTLRGESPGWPGNRGTTIAQVAKNKEYLIINGAMPLAWCQSVENMAFASLSSLEDKDSNTAGSGILIVDGYNTRLNNVVVLGAHKGIHVRGGINVRIQSCKVTRRSLPASETAFGIVFDGTHERCSSNLVSDTILDFHNVDARATTYGVDYQGGLHDLALRNLEVVGADYGVFLRKAPDAEYNYNIQIINPIIDQYRKCGIFFEGFTDGSPCILGGWFAAARGTTEPQHGVLANRSVGLKVHGAEFLGYHHANALSVGVEIRNGAHSLVTGNSFRNFKNAVVLAGSANASVANNSFLNLEAHLRKTEAKDGSAGVLVKDRSSRISVTGNTFGGHLNNGVAIEPECGYNLTAMNTWTGPNLQAFYRNDGGTTNQEALTVGN